MFARRYKLFNLHGFDVKLDLSWFLIAFLVMFSLSVAYFPLRYPQLTGATYVGMGILGVVGLFASVVIHEFFHAVVARRFSIPMTGITLFVFGGLAEMSEEPPSPKSEFWMAVAGPLASLALAGLFWFVYDMGVFYRWPLPVIGLCDYLWQINLVLFVFNLLPAFPLDGGRIMRSAIWQWKKNLEYATRLSARIGAGFGSLLMIFGIVAFFFGNFIGGFWYFFIGAFIRWAANASYRKQFITSSLEGLSVADIMESHVVAVPSHLTLADLVQDYILEYRHQAFPVTDQQDHLLGVVFLRRVKEITKERWPFTQVRDVMTHDFTEITVERNVPAVQLFKKMVAKGIHRCMVVESGQLIGVVTLHDLLKYVSIKAELGGDEPIESEAILSEAS